MYQRIVCFKFTKNSSEEEIQRHVGDFKSLKEKIPQIIDYSAGKTVAGDFGSAPEYDIMHYLTFSTTEDIDIYFNHSEHKCFIDRNKTLWEKVLVINSEM